MEKKCKLTISILASNRKDTIPKCLESIKPLLENVDSELIITDTGCDEELLDIIRKYTDKIVKFQWCNDFAKARNVGLEMACGQWFMYIDDDEWFENVDELVGFFNSEEEKEYESANYIVRNYHTKTGDEYGEWAVGRIFRIHEDTKFVGRVHEYAASKQGNMKQLFSYAHHYGYAFETDEERLIHSNRNISLIEKEIEAEPSDARNYAHIYQEYRANDEPELMLKYTKLAMKNVDMKRRENRIRMCSTYVAIVWAYMRMKEYDKVIKKAEEILEKESISELTKAALYAYLVEACMQCKEYKKCVKYAKEYIGLYKLFARDKERFYIEMGPLLNDVLRDNIMFGVHIAGIEAAVENNDIEGFSYFLKCYDWTKGWDVSKLEELKKFVDMTIEYGEDEDTLYILGMIFTDVHCSKAILNRLQEVKEIDSDGYAKICDIIARIAGQPGYRSLVQIVTACKNGNLELLTDTYIKIYMEDDKILLVGNEFYEFAMDHRVWLGDIISNIPLGRWKELLKIWLMNAHNKDIVRTKKYMDLYLAKAPEYRRLLEENVVDELYRRKK